MRVLVVEDARQLADAIARGLRAEGMAVDSRTTAILRAVVAAHGRTVGATPIPAGGLRVRVSLPAG